MFEGWAQIMKELGAESGKHWWSKGKETETGEHGMVETGSPKDNIEMQLR